MYLAVAKPSVVSPIAAEQLVALYSESGQISVGVVVEQSVTELDQTRTGAAGDDLMKWVKGIECIRRDASFSMSGRVWWLGAGSNRRIRRNGERSACSLEGPVAGAASS